MGACVRKPHTPRSDDAGGRSGGGARRRRARRGGGKGRRKAPSRTASMETIQEAEVPGPAPGADAAGDNRTYSNPAFQGGWLGRDGTTSRLLASVSRLGSDLRGTTGREIALLGH
jgi:hypothetical protein